jgi:cyclopropane fatty-acyl-phospholipid synthase-like methyltransferase
MESIPLESDQDWWWYKARLNVLTYILKNISSDPLKILEIGPGKGNNLNTLSKFGSVDVLETDLNFIKHIKDSTSVKIGNYYKNFNEIEKKYDLIILLDVIEHIENTKVFMDEVTKILLENGKIIVSVPAYKSLWSIHDEKLKHFRRYTWKMLYKELENYTILKRQGFNWMLLPVRYLQIKYSDNIHSTAKKSNLLNKILYSISVVEHFLRRLKIDGKFGISLFVVAQKKPNPY